jgi:hypothetical protein
MSGKRVSETTFRSDIFSRLNIVFLGFSNDPKNVVKNAIDMMANESITDDTVLGDVFLESGMGVPVLAGYLHNQGVKIPVESLANLRVCELLNCLQ